MHSRILAVTLAIPALLVAACKTSPTEQKDVSRSGPPPELKLRGEAPRQAEMQHAVWERNATEKKASKQH